KTTMPGKRGGRFNLLGQTYSPEQSPTSPANTIGAAKKSDSKALQFFLDAQDNERHGRLLVAQSQYIEALTAAKAQKNGDPKFVELVETSLKSLRLRIGHTGL